MRWSTSIRAVALFEAAKGALVLLAGFGVLSLVHSDIQDMAEDLLDHLHLNPASRYPHIFLDAVTRVNNWGLWKLAALAAGYAAVRLVEAYGLWRQRLWAEWFAALSGAIYVPFEIRGVMHGHGLTAAVALTINVAIVVVMLYALYRTHKLHHKLP
jgi:uncharacterized membrane protein (DUF2068 family)